MPESGRTDTADRPKANRTGVEGCLGCDPGAGSGKAGGWENLFESFLSSMAALLPEMGEVEKERKKSLRRMIKILCG